MVDLCPALWLRTAFTWIMTECFKGRTFGSHFDGPFDRPFDALFGYPSADRLPLDALNLKGFCELKNDLCNWSLVLDFLTILNEVDVC